MYNLHGPKTYMSLSTNKNDQKNGSLQTIRSHLSNSAAQIFPPLAVAISKTCAVSPLSSSGTLHSSRCWPQKRMETPGPNLRNGWVLQNGIKSNEVTCCFW